MYCDFGEKITTQFQEFNNELNKSNWFEFPIDYQRMYVIVLANAQQMVIVKGFGNIPCTREAMKNVILINIIVSISVEMTLSFSLFSLSIVVLFHLG